MDSIQRRAQGHDHTQKAVQPEEDCMVMTLVMLISNQNVTTEYLPCQQTKYYSEIYVMFWHPWSPIFHEVARPHGRSGTKLQLESTDTDMFVLSIKLYHQLCNLVLETRNVLYNSPRNNSAGTVVGAVKPNQWEVEADVETYSIIYWKYNMEFDYVNWFTTSFVESPFYTLSAPFSLYTKSFQYQLRLPIAVHIVSQCEMLWACRGERFTVSTCHLFDTQL